jgi:hypothetical protein
MTVEITQDPAVRGPKRLLLPGAWKPGMEIDPVASKVWNSLS